MDKTAQANLSVAHANLADDLANLSQLIQPESQQALGMLNRCQRRLMDIEELVRHASTSTSVPTPPATPVDDNTIEGLIGGLPEDTLSAVSDTLVVLTYVDWQDGGSCGDNFACGMLRILNCAIEALDHEKGRVGSLRKGAS
jgi:hypothetical protein